jgi:hypothetical protein
MPLGATAERCCALTLRWWGRISFGSRSFSGRRGRFPRCFPWLIWLPAVGGRSVRSSGRRVAAVGAVEAGLGAWYRWRRCCADPHPWPSLPGRSRGSEGGSPSPRPSPPREGETLAAFVEKDAPRCWRAFLSEGQQRDGRNRGHRAFKQRPEVLPLPGGEGRGEGEPPSDVSPAPPRSRGESPSDFW